MTPSYHLRASRPAALAIIYPKVGNVLRVPLRRTATGGGNGCAQHPERQFVRWFNRMSAARPGFPLQVRSILLLTGEPLCASCRRTLARFLNQYQLAGRLRVRSSAGGAGGCGCGRGSTSTGFARLPRFAAGQHLPVRVATELTQVRVLSEELGEVGPPYVGQQEYEGWFSSLRNTLRRHSAKARLLIELAKGAHPQPDHQHAAEEWARQQQTERDTQNNNQQRRDAQASNRPVAAGSPAPGLRR